RDVAKSSHPPCAGTAIDCSGLRVCEDASDIEHFTWPPDTRVATLRLMPEPSFHHGLAVHSSPLRRVPSVAKLQYETNPRTACARYITLNHIALALWPPTVR